MTSQLWIKLSVVVDKTCYHNNVSLHPVCTSKLLGKLNKMQRTLLALMSILFRERIHNSSSKSPFDCMLFLFALQCDPMWLWGNSGNCLTYMLEFVVVLVRKVNYEYGLLTKCEVKMAGYWPSSFFCVFMDWDEVEVHKLAKKERGQYPAILTEQTWSKKDLLYGFWWNFACRI